MQIFINFHQIVEENNNNIVSKDEAVSDFHLNLVLIITYLTVIWSDDRIASG